jgi:hypothetical protein
MATAAEIEQRIAAARAALGPLEAANGAARREVAVLEAEKDQLIAAARKQAQGGDQAGAALLRQQAAQLDARIDAAGDPAAQALEAEQAKIRTLENDLYAAQQKADFDAKQTAPTAPAEVKESADGATQNPAPPPASANERLTTNQAATLAANTDAGTNAPVKTLAQTQSVPPANTGRSTEGRPAGPAGVGAGEDSGQTASNTQRILNSFNKTRFVPKNNILDQYASYTYNIAWYLMPLDGLTALKTTGKPNYASYSLLMQSGGASTAPNAEVARNEFFQLDYYIDNLEIKSKISGKGTGRSNNTTEIAFTVTETTGITLIDNLYNAVQSVYKNSGVPYVSAVYLLAIRFYGYDENGKIVQASNGDNNNAVVEKFMPFQLSELNFSVGNKLVEYSIKAKPLIYNIAYGSNLGVIKKQIQITGATVKDLLMNGIPGAEVSAADGRISTPRPPAPPVSEAAVVGTNAVVDENGSFTGESASPFQVGA